MTKSFDGFHRDQSPIETPALANPRVSHLEALARAIAAKYPAITTRLELTSPGRPAMLRTAYKESSEIIECDFTEQGWEFACGQGDNPIGPARDPAGAAYTIARLLGLRRNM